VGYPRGLDGSEDEPPITLAERACRLHHGQDDPEVWHYPAIELSDALVVRDIIVAVSPKGLEPTRVERSEVISESDWLNPPPPRSSDTTLTAPAYDISDPSHCGTRTK
jgi:hypothetical protein